MKLRINLSMRARLALWSALTIPGLIFILAFTARSIMVSSLNGDLDYDLESSANAIFSQVSESGGIADSDTLRRIVEQNFANLPLFIRFSNTQGKLVSRYGELPRPIIPTLDKLAESPPAQPAFQTVKIRDVNSIRVYTRPTFDAASQEPTGTLQLAASLASLGSAEYRLLVFTLVIGVGGTLVTLAATFLIVARTLRPLERILARVREVQSKNLHGGLAKESRPPELQELATSLNSMWQRLEAAFENQQAFVGTVSHDLRTPLSAIQGQVDVLLMRPNLDENTRTSLRRMLDEVHRLVSLTNHLLLKTQLEAYPQLQARAVNLRDLADEVVNENWPLAGERELRVEAPTDVAVEGDSDLLKEMLLNVVDNAIKYTPPDGAVVIQVRRDGDDARLSVLDNGRGIPADQLTHVTERFFRNPSSNPIGTGTEDGVPRVGAGLGLSIVKQIIDLHHGTLSIASTEGEGTVVTVHLACAGKTPSLSASAPLPPPQLIHR